MRRWRLAVVTPGDLRRKCHAGIWQQPPVAARCANGPGWVWRAGNLSKHDQSGSDRGAGFVVQAGPADMGGRGSDPAGSPRPRTCTARPWWAAAGLGRAEVLSLPTNGASKPLSRLIRNGGTQIPPGARQKIRASRFTRRERCASPTAMACGHSRLNPADSRRSKQLSGMGSSGPRLPDGPPALHGGLPSRSSLSDFGGPVRRVEPHNDRRENLSPFRTAWQHLRKLVKKVVASWIRHVARHGCEQHIQGVEIACGSSAGPRNVACRQRSSRPGIPRMSSEEQCRDCRRSRTRSRS